MPLAAAKGSNITGVFAQFMFRSDDGYPMGTSTSPNSVANGTTTSAYVTKAFLGFQIGQNTLDRVTLKGSQSVIAKVPIGIGDYGVSTLDLALDNETLNAYLNRSSVDNSTVDGWVMSAPNMAQFDFPPMVMAIQGRFTNADNGASQWKSLLYHNVQITRSTIPGFGQVEGEVTNPNPVQFSVDSTISGNVLGLGFGSTSLNVVSDNDTFTEIRTPNPLAFTSYVADGAAGSFTLPFTPVYSDADGATNNLILKNGVQSSVDSINTGTRAVAYSGATAGDVFTVAYQVSSNNIVAA